MNMPKAGKLLFLLTLLTLPGCDDPGQPASSEPPSAVDLERCNAASEHFATCTGLKLDLTLACDPATAADVLATNCEALSAPGKADVFADAFCASGLLYWCELPTCEAAPPDPADFIGRCEELLELEDCRSCAFYDCLELERGEASCGPTGYYRGFVGPYCQRFSQLTHDALSPRGQAWIEDVRACLQESMIGVDPEATCEQIKRRGYDAHPGCYVETGFCELPLADQWKIFTTVDPRDLGVEQPLRTALACLGA